MDNEDEDGNEIEDDKDWDESSGEEIVECAEVEQ